MEPVRVEERLNAAKYRNIFNENLVQNTQDLRLDRRGSGLGQWSWQHWVLKWLRRSSVNVIELNSHSLIEPNQTSLKNPENGCPPVFIQPGGSTNKSGRKSTKSRCAKLVASNPKRLEAVMTAKGAATKYWIFMPCNYFVFVYSFVCFVHFFCICNKTQFEEKNTEWLNTDEVTRQWWDTWLKSIE